MKQDAETIQPSDKHQRLRDSDTWDEVVVPKPDSLVGAGVSYDRLDRLLHKRRY